MTGTNPTYWTVERLVHCKLCNGQGRVEKVETMGPEERRNFFANTTRDGIFTRNDHTGGIFGPDADDDGDEEIVVDTIECPECQGEGVRVVWRKISEEEIAVMTLAADARIGPAYVKTEGEMPKQGHANLWFAGVFKPG